MRNSAVDSCCIFCYMHLPGPVHRPGPDARSDRAAASDRAFPVSAWHFPQNRARPPWTNGWLQIRGRKCIRRNWVFSSHPQKQEARLLGQSRGLRNWPECTPLASEGSPGAPIGIMTTVDQTTSAVLKSMRKTCNNNSNNDLLASVAWKGASSFSEEEQITRKNLASFLPSFTAKLRVTEWFLFVLKIPGLIRGWDDTVRRPHFPTPGAVTPTARRPHKHRNEQTACASCWNFMPPLTEVSRQNIEPEDGG